MIERRKLDSAGIKLDTMIFKIIQYIETEESRCEIVDYRLDFWAGYQGDFKPDLQSRKILNLTWDFKAYG